MINKIKRWWEDYRLKKSIWAKLSDAIFIVIIVGLIFPDSRIFLVSNFQRLTMWGPSELKKEKQVKIADETYQWNMYDLNGKPYSFSETKGKVVFINLWATWCPPCIAEMPSIEKLYLHFKDNPNIVFLLVTNETPEKVNPFMQKREFQFPVMISSQRVPQDFFSETIPATFVVDKNGVIIMKEQRAKKWHGDETIKLLEELIQNK
jgi:thiol-disulfide isomerase/thioredoxin